MLLKKSLSIRAKLIIASASTVAIAMVLLTSMNVWSARQSTESLVMQQVRALSESGVHGLSEWAANKIEVVNALGVASRYADPVQALGQAQHGGGFQVSYMAWADKRHAFSPPQQLPDGWDPTSRPWYQEAAKAREAIFTTPYLDTGTGKLVVSVASPVIDQGEVQAVVASDIALDNVIAAVRVIKPSINSFAYLIDGRGDIIAHPNAGLTLKPSTDAIKELDRAALMTLAEQAVPRTVQVDGADYWVEAFKVANTPWMLVVAASQADAFSDINAMARNAVAAGIVAILLTVIVLALLTRILLRRLGQLGAALQDIASGEGDLTRRLDERGNDELSQVGVYFNQFVDKIAGTLHGIRLTTASVNTASLEIAAGNQDLASRTEETSSSLHETASSMEQLSSAVKQTAESATAANQLASDASSAAQQGGTVMVDVVAAMEDISSSSQRIADIIGVIDSIAFQTNILALNAAVEAARAGEQGRGFAVVASEVRSLAQRSAQSAKEIKDLIDSSVGRIDDGSRLVKEAGAAMSQIVASVGKVSSMMNEIRVATGEQSLGIGQVELAVSDLEQMTQQNAALVEESAAAAGSLKEQANRLFDAVSGFRLPADSADAGHALLDDASAR